MWNFICWYWLIGMACSAATLLNGVPLTAAVDKAITVCPSLDKPHCRWFVVLVCVLYVAIQWPRFIPSAYRVIRNLCR